MTSVIKHALRGGVGTLGRFRTEGWIPNLKVTLGGPIPAGSVLVWTVWKPDGSEWFELHEPIPQGDGGSTSVVDLHCREEGTEINFDGTAAFTLRLVSDLEGVDELLHDGSLTAASVGDGCYVVDNDWLLPLGVVFLDTVDEHDAPRLKVTSFHKGDVGAYDFDAHLFYDGTRVAQASYMLSGHTFTASDGHCVGVEVMAEFDAVRGWNNLSDQGWGSDDWHVLDAHDGGYEVRVVREGRVVRRIEFEVVAGMLVSQGAVENDPRTGPVLLVEAVVQGDLDGERSDTGLPFYGDAATAAAWSSIEAVYSLRSTPIVVSAAPFDDPTMSGLQSCCDAAERLVDLWERDMLDAEPPYSSDLVNQAQVVVDDVERFRHLRAAVSAVPPEHTVDYGGGTTLGELTTRVLRIDDAARRVIDGASDAHVQALAPYRAVLNNDKLRIFEDHPATSFQYLTTNGAVISSPSELAESEYWYFEGVTESSGTATANGLDVKVRIQGWRVLGWQFDGDGRIVEEWELHGEGSSAPKSAFTGPRVP